MRTRATLRAIATTRFTLAQVCLGGAILSDLAAAIAGAVAASSPSRVGSATLGLAGLALLSVTLRQASAASAGAAHDILRRLDLMDGLGHKIDPATAADLQDDTPFLVHWLALRQTQFPYFASSHQPSPRRLVENLYESTWWTKRLARDMTWGSAAFAAVIWSIGIFMLIATTNEVWAPESWGAGTLSALILFLIATGPQHARRQYAELREGAERVQHEAERLLGKEPTEAQALALACEYHLKRQGAAVIPTPWYRLRRGRLNALWDDVVAERTPSRSDASKRSPALDVDPRRHAIQPSSLTPP